MGDDQPATASTRDGLMLKIGSPPIGAARGSQMSTQNYGNTPAGRLSPRNAFDLSHPEPEPGSPRGDGYLGSSMISKRGANLME